MFFKLTDDLIVNIHEIDEWNKGLFLKIGVLHHAISAGAPASTMGLGSTGLSSLFKSIEDHVIIHYNAEEGIMARHDYPDLSIHKDEHGRFKGIFGRLKEKCELGPARRELAIEVDEVVCDWLIRHVCMADKAFAKFLRTLPPDKEAKAGRRFF